MKTINITIKVVLISLVSVFLVSCGSTYRSSNVNRDLLEDSEKVIYQNMRLKAMVGVVDLSDGYTNNHLHSNLRIKNLTSRRVNIEVMFKFKDRQGYEVSEIGWDPVSLDPGQVTTIRRISNVTNAVDYTVIMRVAG